MYTSSVRQLLQKIFIFFTLWKMYLDGKLFKTLANGMF